MSELCGRAVAVSEVTKYRRGVFTNEILDDLKPIFASVCAEFKAEPVGLDGEDDMCTSR
ncbi:MAG: transposase [Desulfovibrio sp.]|nr:transposase [Desulfovibrio sp.]